MTTSPIRRNQYHADPPETMSESGANILRTKIERAWLDRGVYVRVWVERMAWTRGAGEGWVVRSDLVGGMPAGAGISFPNSRSDGHTARAGDGQLTRASLRESPFAWIKGHLPAADKARCEVPTIPANPSNEGPQSP